MSFLEEKLRLLRALQADPMIEDFSRGDSTDNLLDLVKSFDIELAYLLNYTSVSQPGFLNPRFEIFHCLFFVHHFYLSKMKLCNECIVTNCQKGSSMKTYNVLSNFGVGVPQIFFLTISVLRTFLCVRKVPCKQ